MGLTRTVFQTNIHGTQAVLEFCRKRGAKIVYAGSSTKFTSECPGKDLCPYSWTKAHNTDLIINYGKWFGVNYAIAYFCNVYGPREIGAGEYATVIGVFREKYLSSLPLPVTLPGTQKRNFTHVLDTVEGVFRVGEYGNGDGYCLARQDSYSILDIVNLFNSEILYCPEKKGNRMNTDLDLRKSNEELNWFPIRDIKTYVSEIISDANRLIKVED